MAVPKASRVKPAGEAQLPGGTLLASLPDRRAMEAFAAATHGVGNDLVQQIEAA